MIEVVCGVLIQKEKCFIARRNYGSSKGWYEFPGGKVEAGESKEAALKREWQEELDIEIENIQYLASSKDQQDYPFHLTCLRVLRNKLQPIRMPMTNGFGPHLITFMIILSLKVIKL